MPTEDFDIQAGERAMTMLEAIEAYPEGAEIAARELGVTVEELRAAFEETAKRRLPIVGDPNQPKVVEPRLLQIHEPSELDRPVGEGSTTLDMWRFRAQKAETEREQYRLEIENLLAQVSSARNDIQTLLIVLRDRDRAAKFEDLIDVLTAIEERNPIPNETESDPIEADQP